MNILGKVIVPTFYNCQSVLELSLCTLVFMPCLLLWGHVPHSFPLSVILFNYFFSTQSSSEFINMLQNTQKFKYSF